MDHIQSENDYELLYMIYQMDEDSLHTLLYKYRSLGQAQLHFYFGSAEIKEYGEDYMAEMMVMIYRAIYAYRQDRQASFSTFYHRLFHNHVINYRRHFYTYRGRCDRMRLSLDATVHDSDTAMVHFLINRDMSLEGVSILIREQQKEKLKKLFHQLKPIERQVIWMYHEGYRYQEIMEQLHMDYRQVEYILTKVRKSQALID